VEDGREHSLQDKDIPPYVTIYRVHGPFLFGSTDKMERIHREIPGLPPIIVLRLRNMTALDATGLQAIAELADKLHASGRHLLICGARPQPAKLFERAEFHEHLGAENILPHVSAALVRARELYEASLMRGFSPARTR